MSSTQVVARFNTPEDHDKLVQGIIREKQIRQRIAELKELESRGIKNLGEIEEELEGKRKKERKREGDSYTDKVVVIVGRVRQGEFLGKTMQSSVPTKRCSTSPRKRKNSARS